jgi:arsenite methyltransferase
MIPDVKTIVQEKYTEIARAGQAGCGCGCGCGTDVSMIGDEYKGVEGYVADADLGLGCGVPTDLANIRPGQTVLDLGSGAGIDAFVARSIVGETGQVIGLDMTPEMIAKARANAERMGYENVRFVQGDIEKMPVESKSVDVVISNCVLNLVPDKDLAFAEMHRVIRPGGHFCVSDIVVRGELPEAVKHSAELYAGCVAGAIPEAEYLDKLQAAGFTNVRVLKEKVIDVPDDALPVDAGREELAAFRSGSSALLSVTVYGERASS